MSYLELFLFGPPRIIGDGLRVEMGSRKAVALLSYLAVTQKAHRRESLANLLWPDHGRASAYSLLRRALYVLRKHLPDGTLAVSRETVTMDLDFDIRVDVNRFKKLLAESRAHDHDESITCPGCLTPLSEAAELYQDDFLEGFSLRGSVNFDDWQFFELQALQREYADVLRRLIQYHASLGEFATAIRLSRKWLALDRLHEPAHCLLMKLFVWSGQRSLALRQYNDCCRILETEVYASPMAPTTALFEAIQAGRLPEPPHRPVYQLAPVNTVEKRRSVRNVSEISIMEESHIVTVLVLNARCASRDDRAENPEGDSNVVARLLDRAEGIIHRYGGETDRFLADSALAVFGKSKIREDEPELAIRAALEISRETRKTGLAAAAGINTGLVYFTDTDSEDGPKAALRGSVVNLAFRLGERAAHSEILVGESAYRYTRRSFQFTTLSLAIRGSDEPMIAYKVERLLPEARKARGIDGLRSELVGREYELAALENEVAEFQQGRGRIVSVVGEAGIGKSRLVEELKLVAGGISKPAITEPESRDPAVDFGGSGIRWLEGRCVSTSRSVTYGIFLDILRSYFNLSYRDSDAAIAGKITQGAADLFALDYEGMLPFMGHLLSFRFGSDLDGRLEHLTPEQLRDQTLMRLQDLIEAIAAKESLLLVLEDIHWADDLSLELIHRLMDSLSKVPFLLLCIFRPERGHRARHLNDVARRKCRDSFTEIILNPLSNRQSSLLVERLLKIEDLPDYVRKMILDKSEGNPFYIEEVIRSLMDQGFVYNQAGHWKAGIEIAGFDVPNTIGRVVLSRLDLLPPGPRRFLEYAAVIGRLFEHRLLKHLAGDEVDLERYLSELEEKDLQTSVTTYFTPKLNALKKRVLCGN